MAGLSNGYMDMVMNYIEDLNKFDPKTQRDVQNQLGYDLTPQGIDENINRAKNFTGGGMMTNAGSTAPGLWNIAKNIFMKPKMPRTQDITAPSMLRARKEVQLANQIRPYAVETATAGAGLGLNSASDNGVGWDDIVDFLKERYHKGIRPGSESYVKPNPIDPEPDGVFPKPVKNKSKWRTVTQEDLIDADLIETLRRSKQFKENEQIVRNKYNNPQGLGRDIDLENTDNYGTADSGSELNNTDSGSELDSIRKQILDAKKQKRILEMKLQAQKDAQRMKNDSKFGPQTIEITDNTEPVQKPRKVPKKKNTSRKFQNKRKAVPVAAKQQEQRPVKQRAARVDPLNIFGNKDGYNPFSNKERIAAGQKKLSLLDLFRPGVGTE